MWVVESKRGPWREATWCESDPERATGSVGEQGRTDSRGATEQKGEKWAVTSSKQWEKVEAGLDFLLMLFIQEVLK